MGKTWREGAGSAIYRQIFIYITKMRNSDNKKSQTGRVGKGGKEIPKAYPGILLPLAL
jgi:hypothetical protein